MIYGSTADESDEAPAAAVGYRLVATPTANRHTGKPTRASFRILK